MILFIKTYSNFHKFSLALFDGEIKDPPNHNAFLLPFFFHVFNIGVIQFEFY